MTLKRNDYPDWLSLLCGESPLLERPELEFIAEVRHRIINETKPAPGFNCNKHLKSKLSRMKDNFAKVVKYLKENSQSKEYFLNTYPTWQTVRNLTIFQLKEIAKSVDEDSRNCSVSRGLGSTVSLIGGLICLAGGSGASRTVGSVMMGLGSVTSAGTSAIETELLKKKIEKAQTIIQEDKEYTEKLWNWISDLSYVEEALDAVRYIDVGLNMKRAASDFHVYYKQKRNSNVRKNIEQIMKSLNFSPEMINEISDVIGMLIAISMLYDTYRPLFNRVYEVYKCKKILSTARDVLLASMKVASAVNVGRSSELTNLQKTKIASGIALDAINIILTSKGVNSTSEEAKQITKAAEKLVEEAEVFQKLYDTMNGL